MSNYVLTNDPGAEDDDEMISCDDCGLDFYPEDLYDGLCDDCEIAREDEALEEEAREIDEDGE